MKARRLMGFSRLRRPLAGSSPLSSQGDLQERPGTPLKKQQDEETKMKKSKFHSNRGDFRIESNRAMRSTHWALASGTLLHDRSLAVAMAAKTRTEPCGGEIRVVYTPTGEVIFRKRNECGGLEH